MEKIAIIELNTNYIQMQQVDVYTNKSFTVRDCLQVPLNLTKDFDKEQIIKSSVITEVTETLSIFKEILDQKGIKDSFCFVSDVIKEAKNCNGFINEVANVSTFKFEILTPEITINNVYTAVINTMNKPKGLVIDVSDYSTNLLYYNRRNVLSTTIVPYGKINLNEKFKDFSGTEEEKCDAMRAFFAEQIDLLEAWGYDELPEEWEIIGAGSVFRNVGVVSRRAKKYPLDIEHNYEMSRSDVDKVYNAIKTVDASTNKLKGISVSDTLYIKAGISIIEAIMDKVNKDKISVSKYGFEYGILFNYVLPLTVEKPIADNIGYSLQAITEAYDGKEDVFNQVYNLSIILFKQLKVIHKLSRNYVRVLRVASYLAECGRRVNGIEHIKSSFNTIVNSDLFGLTHAEIVLAGFVAKLRDADNFNLAEWVKYKDLVTEEDLVAVKKLAMLVKLAEALDITRKSAVADINCDILGDSVILKTVCNSEAKLEIKYSMLLANEFKKTFAKNLEII
ncbi:MAG: hypothetical protein E7361_01345 [Clostridiales bacterium]|nr:hypothetical protein [Clostridiales bacterium]